MSKAKKEARKEEYKAKGVLKGLIKKLETATHDSENSTLYYKNVQLLEAVINESHETMGTLSQFKSGDVEDLKDQVRKARGEALIQLDIAASRVKHKPIPTEEQIRSRAKEVAEGAKAAVETARSQVQAASAEKAAAQKQEPPAEQQIKPQATELNEVAKPTVPLETTLPKVQSDSATEVDVNKVSKLVAEAIESRDGVNERISKSKKAKDDVEKTLEALRGEPLDANAHALKVLQLAPEPLQRAHEAILALYFFETQRSLFLVQLSAAEEALKQVKKSESTAPIIEQLSEKLSLLNLDNIKGSVEDTLKELDGLKSALDQKLKDSIRQIESNINAVFNELEVKLNSTQPTSPKGEMAIKSLLEQLGYAKKIYFESIPIKEDTFIVDYEKLNGNLQDAGRRFKQSCEKAINKARPDLVNDTSTLDIINDFLKDIAPNKEGVMPTVPVETAPSKIQTVSAEKAEPAKEAALQTKIVNVLDWIQAAAQLAMRSIEQAKIEHKKAECTKYLAICENIQNLLVELDGKTPKGLFTDEVEKKVDACKAKLGSARDKLANDLRGILTDPNKDAGLIGKAVGDYLRDSTKEIEKIIPILPDTDWLDIFLNILKTIYNAFKDPDKELALVESKQNAVKSIKDRLVGMIPERGDDPNASSKPEVDPPKI